MPLPPTLGFPETRFGTKTQTLLLTLLSVASMAITRPKNRSKD